MSDDKPGTSIMPNGQEVYDPHQAAWELTMKNAELLAENGRLRAALLDLFHHPRHYSQETKRLIETAERRLDQADHAAADR